MVKNAQRFLVFVAYINADLIQEQWFLALSLFKSLKGQENLLLKNLQLKTRVENVRFLSWRTFFVGKNGIQSTDEMAFKRTVTLREFSISRHQTWSAHATVVQRMHAFARKMPTCSCEDEPGKRTRSGIFTRVGLGSFSHTNFLFVYTITSVVPITIKLKRSTKDILFNQTNGSSNRKKYVITN